MNRFKQGLLFAPIILTAGVVKAETLIEGAYLSLGTGISKTQNWKAQPGSPATNFRVSPILRAAVGHRFCNFRVEFEPSYIRMEKKSAEGVTPKVAGHIRTLSNLGNLYYHIPVDAEFSPYVGAGAGFSSIRAFTKSNGVKTDHSNVKFAYQAIAGVEVDIAEQLGVSADYRYFQTEKLNYVNKGIRNHSLNIGLTYFF